MSSFTGEGELRGRLINENTIKTPDGEKHALNFPVGQDKIGEQVVLRSDGKGGQTLTRMLYS